MIFFLKNNKIKYALFEAFKYNNIRIMKYIIENKLCDVNKKMRGDTILHLICRHYMRCDGELIRLLLDHGADPNIKNNLGLTPYECHCDYRREKYGLDGNENLKKIFDEYLLEIKDPGYD
jgi:ankyrin repeat protein